MRIASLLLRVPSRRLIGPLVLAILALAAAAVAGWRCRENALARRNMPALPAAVDRPEELQRRLQAADERCRAHPRSVEAWFELASLYHANSFATQAGKCWQQLAKLQPAEGRWTYYLADLAALESDDVQVTDDLARTVALAPSYSPAWLALGDFEFKRGELVAAEKAYRRRMELLPGDAYAAFGLARVVLQRGDRATAKQQLATLLRDHGDFASAHNLYAELAEADGDAETAKRQRWFGVAAGRYRAADDPWKEALRPYCYDVGQLLIWGDVDLQTKFGDRGKAVFERAVALAPNNSAAWQKLGEYYVDAKDPAKARDAFVHAWGLPEPSELLGNELNDACLALDRPAEALQFMDEAVQRQPDSSIFHNARGLDLAALGRTAEATAAFETAVAKAANNPAPLANLGLILLQQGRRTEARQYFRRALDVQPGFPKALAAEARLELQERNFDAAARLIEPYFQQFPGVHDARMLMADLRLAKALDADRRGDGVSAERISRAGLADIPESSKLHAFLGLQLLQHDDLGRAAAELETAHQNDPSDAKCVAMLATVYVKQRRSDAARSLLRGAVEDAQRRGDRAKADYLSRVLSNLPAAP